MSIADNTPRSEYRVHRQVLHFFIPTVAVTSQIMVPGMTLSQKIDECVNTHFTDPGWHVGFHFNDSGVDVIGVREDLIECRDDKKDK